MLDEETHFLSSESLLSGGPSGLVRSVKRLFLHLGFFDVRIIDGANDGGADLLASRGSELWVIQCKFTKSGSVDEAGVNDCDRALRKYAANRAVLITNATLTKKASQRVQQLKDFAVPVDALNGPDLLSLWKAHLGVNPALSFTPRPYQAHAAAALLAALESEKRALLIMATGLGKSAVAGIVAREYFSKGARNVLVLAHLRELVEQLEESFWTFLPKTVNSQHLHGEVSHTQIPSGLTVATPDAALKMGDYVPDLIIVDEAHHLSQDGMYSKLLNYWEGIPRLGLTATPWRGDKYDIQKVFGKAVFKMGLAEGMAQGWLSDVNYRIFTDNIDWTLVQSASENNYSISELNKLLFIEERDEQILEELLKVWEKVSKPQAIIFCSSIEHAKRMAQLLKSSNPLWTKAEVIHSEMSKRERNVIMNSFKSQRCPVITCVDVFNEGVDVPDVSIIAFLRVTHSRRIFVQQIGRGLRLSQNKERLEVLDFVTDVRRLKELLELRSAYDGEIEVLRKAPSSKIEFNNEADGKLIEHWLRDVADLDTEADDVRLNYPDPDASFERDF